MGGPVSKRLGARVSLFGRTSRGARETPVEGCGFAWQMPSLRELL
jgi:hypothetical protein